MKAVVLARGRGTRMRQPDPSVRLTPEQARMADAGLKAMIPLRATDSHGGPRNDTDLEGQGRTRPFLDYVLSALADAGCHDVCVVVGPEQDVIREYYTDVSPPERVRLSFVVQPHALGTASAVLAAESFTAADPFLVLNADDYYPADVCRAMVQLDGQGLPAFHARTLVSESNIDDDRLRSYAVLRIAPDGRLVDIIEKPDAETMAGFGEDFYVSKNLWRFSRSIFTACRSVARSARGELELPDAVRHAITADGERFQAILVRAPVLDLSRRGDIPDVERRLAGIDPRP